MKLTHGAKFSYIQSKVMVTFQVNEMTFSPPSSSSSSRIHPFWGGGKKIQMRTEVWRILAKI